MHDDDESVTEAAERIVAEENDRMIKQVTQAMIQVPELMVGLAAAMEDMMAALTPTLEQMKKLVAEIHNHERDTIAFWENQFDY